MHIVSLNLLAAMGKKTAPCVKCYFLCVYIYTYMFFTCNKFSISMRCVLRTPFSSSVRRSLNRTSQPSVQVGLFVTSVPISPSGSPWVDRKCSKRGKPQPVYGKTLCPCQTCLNCDYFPALPATGKSERSEPRLCGQSLTLILREEKIISTQHLVFSQWAHQKTRHYSLAWLHPHGIRLLRLHSALVMTTVFGAATFHKGHGHCFEAIVWDCMKRLGEAYVA